VRDDIIVVANQLFGSPLTFLCALGSNVSIRVAAPKTKKEGHLRLEMA
jgi:hypothetical protein